MSGRILSGTVSRISMRSILWMLVFSTVALSTSACSNKSTETAAGESVSDATMKTVGNKSSDPIARGAYLVNIGGCNDCHTPMKMGPQGPVPDESKMLSGHPAGQALPAIAVPQPYLMVATPTAFSGPWGTSYAANLTADTATGIGLWKADDFIRVLRSGKHWGSDRPIMPPMPWQNLARVDDEDLRAMYAYLRSIPRIDNEAPAYQPPTTGGTPAPKAAPPANSEVKP